MDFGCRNICFSGQTAPFETGVLNCGHELVLSPEYRWDGMRRGSKVIYVWQYTIAGRGAIRLEKEVHPLLPGQAFFVRIPGDHLYFLPEDSESWEFLFLTLYGSETDRLGGEFIRRYGNILSHGEASPATAFVRTLFDEALTGATPERSVLAAYEFLLTLFREQQPNPHSVPAAALLEKAKNYLYLHFAEPLQISHLAEICHCSRSHFSRQFHAVSGKTPQEFLREMRLHAALRLLQTERKSVKEIAMDAGFEDPSYFCRVFRLKYNMTPEEFRSGKKGR